MHIWGGGAHQNLALRTSQAAEGVLVHGPELRSGGCLHFGDLKGQEAIHMKLEKQPFVNDHLLGRMSQWDSEGAWIMGLLGPSLITPSL